MESYDYIVKFLLFKGTILSKIITDKNGELYMISSILDKFQFHYFSLGNGSNIQSDVWKTATIWGDCPKERTEF